MCWLLAAIRLTAGGEGLYVSTSDFGRSHCINVWVSRRHTSSRPQMYSRRCV